MAQASLPMAHTVHMNEYSNITLFIQLFARKWRILLSHKFSSYKSLSSLAFYLSSWCADAMRHAHMPYMMCKEKPVQYLDFH